MRNSWERDENMSSKKYDANIGTTRQANAAQHDAAAFLLFIFLCNVRLLEPVALSLVLDLEQEGQDECEHAE